MVFRSAAFEMNGVFTLNRKYLFGVILMAFLHLPQIGALRFLLCTFVTYFVTFDIVLLGPRLSSISPADLDKSVS